MYKISELISSAKKVELGAVARNYNRKMSLRILSSDSSGSKITLSSMLCERLGLKRNDTVKLMPVPSKGVMVVAKNIDTDDVYEFVELKEKDKALYAYGAPIINLIIKDFSLDFSKHVSKSFPVVELHDDDATVPYAVVDMNDGNNAPVQEDSEDDDE